MTPEGRVETRARLAPSSEWFSGHFEGCPVAPAVALLALAVETVKHQGHKEGRRLEVSGFPRVRFRRLVFPDDELHISVAAMPPRPDAELHFHVTCRGNTVAEGVLRAGEGVTAG